MENLTLLGTGNISGTGNALNNLITGNAGANVLNGSSGADNMRGLAGSDIYIVDNAGDIVNESLAGSTGVDTVQSSISFSLSNATRAIGAVENLTLLGSAAIDGTGTALSNTIVGNAAANVVNGAAGNDRIIGGGGNDTLLGSTGMDTVTGDLGNDIFRFVEAPTAADRDVITDFANVAGNNDSFQLEKPSSPNSERARHTHSTRPFSGATRLASPTTPTIMSSTTDRPGHCTTTATARPPEERCRLPRSLTDCSYSCRLHRDLTETAANTRIL